MSARPAAPDFRQQLSAIRRAVERCGLVLTLHGRIVSGLDGEPAPEGPQLLDALKIAWVATDGHKDRHVHVGQLVAGLARAAADTGGPLRLNRTAWVLLASYALTGQPPRRLA